MTVGVGKGVGVVWRTAVVGTAFVTKETPICGVAEETAVSVGTISSSSPDRQVVNNRLKITKTTNNLCITKQEVYRQTAKWHGAATVTHEKFRDDA